MSRSLSKTQQNCASEVQKIKKYKKERQIWQIFKKTKAKISKPVKLFNTEQEAQEYIKNLNDKNEYFILKW